MDNYIKRFHDTERWADVEMPEIFSNKFKLEISNYGIVKRTEKETHEIVILKQFKTEGYAQAKFTMLEKISDKDNDSFILTRKIIFDLDKEIKELTKLSETENFDILKLSEILTTIEQKQFEVNKIRNSYIQKYKKNHKKRKRNFSNLVHRLVAIHFVEKPSDNHNLVAHIDYDKLNNHHSNLKWMTREENVQHQLGSPFVVKSKIKAMSIKRITRSKLTTSQVSILKKRMNEGVPLTDLAKRYPVTQTQLLRIKRGENWAKIPAAR
jgi:HNH endonuclease